MKAHEIVPGHYYRQRTPNGEFTTVLVIGVSDRTADVVLPSGLPVSVPVSKVYSPSKHDEPELFAEWHEGYVARLSDVGEVGVEYMRTPSWTQREGRRTPRYSGGEELWDDHGG